MTVGGWSEPAPYKTSSRPKSWFLSKWKFVQVSAVSVAPRVYTRLLKLEETFISKEIRILVGLKSSDPPPPLQSLGKLLYYYYCQISRTLNFIYIYIYSQSHETISWIIKKDIFALLDDSLFMLMSWHVKSFDVILRANIFVVIRTNFTDKSAIKTNCLLH